MALITVQFVFFWRRRSTKAVARMWSTNRENYLSKWTSLPYRVSATIINQWRHYVSLCGKYEIITYLFCLVAQGINQVTRASVDSSVTRFYDLAPLTRNLAQFTAEEDWCNCGWPAHMLIPKGSVEGLKCQLFVMVTDSDIDQVQQY